MTMYHPPETEIMKQTRAVPLQLQAGRLSLQEYDEGQ